MSVKCPECKKKCNNDCSYCPNCGHKLEKEQEKLGIIGLLFIIYFSYSTCSSNMNNVNTKAENENEKPITKVEHVSNLKSGNDIKVLQDNWCKLEYSDTGICITVTNNSKTDKEYVKIILNLYDKNGKLLKVISDDMNDLKTGEKWKFGLPTMKDVASYKVKDINYKEY